MSRRGFTLVIALTVMTLVGAAVSVLILQIGDFRHQQRRERAQVYSKILLDCAKDYAKAHAAELNRLPEEDMKLPVDGLLSAPAQGSILLRKVNQDSLSVRISVQIGSTAIHNQHSLSLQAG